MKEPKSSLEKFVDSLTPDEILFLSNKINNDAECTCKQLQDALQKQIDVIDKDEIESLAYIAYLRFGERIASHKSSPSYPSATTSDRQTD